MSSTAWEGVKGFWSGYNAGLTKALQHCGGNLGGEIGALKSLVGDLSMALIDYKNDPSTDNARKVENICVDIGSSMGGAELGAWLGGMATLGNPLGMIAGAAIGAAVASLFGDQLQEFYQFLKEQGFEGIEWWMDNIAPKPGRFSHLQDIYDAFYDAKGYVPPATRRDPLILDLDGDGVETTNVKDGAFFDHDGNGFAEQTGWAASDDGLLVLDRNGDGIINDGRELFGDQTILANGQTAANGFQALAELDSNHDGRIDANDVACNQLRVWQDIDGDGYSATDELKTLAELGITSISIESSITNVTDAQGNTQTRVGSFTKSDGTTSAIANVSLQRDTTYTIANEWLDVPADIAALPDIQGYGNVYDLQQAMVRDTSGQLKSLVEQFAAATDVVTRNNLMEQIIYKWTGSDGIASNSRGANIDARSLAAMEAFFGETFVSQYGTNPTAEASILLQEAYRGLSEMTYSQLMSQTHLQAQYNEINYTWDEGTQSVKADLSAVITDIEAELAANPEQGKQLLSEFARTIRGLGAQEMTDYLSFRETFISQDESLGWVIDSAGLKVFDQIHTGTRGWSPHMEGTDNADAVKGSLTEGDGYINGLAGNDVIWTGRNQQRTFRRAA